MKRPFATAYTYAEFLTFAVLFVPVMAAARLGSRGDPSFRVAGRWLRRFGKLTSRLTPLWHFSIEGEAPSDISSRAYVVVCNHESNADPFLLSWLPWDMRWISKAELFKLPLVGTLLRLGGDIALRRGDGDSVQHMMAECQKTLACGLSVMIFPEGTRSPDGSLGAFKDGAFRLAIEAQVPVLPLALAGTRDCLPKQGSLHEARAMARVLCPIETRNLTLADLATLRERVRDQIAEARRELDAALAPK